MKPWWHHPPLQNRVAEALHGGWRWASRFGTLGPDTRAGRRFGAMGPGSALAFPPGPTFGERWVRIGDRCNIGRGSAIVGRLRIDIGDDVTTGPNVYVTDHNHRYDDPDVPIARQWVTEAPVTIGPGCWLGAGVVVLPGTTLGRNVVVAAGSVVRGEVPDGCVAAGVPAQVVRRPSQTG